jgi:hypothetical protein
LCWIAKILVEKQWIKEKKLWLKRKIPSKLVKILGKKINMNLYKKKMMIGVLMKISYRL